MAHYFDEVPTSDSDKKEIEARIAGIDLLFTSDADVFSRKQVDFGSRLLLETAISDLKSRGIRKGRLLDLGCGYGVLGITMKRALPAMDVVMADINQRAVSLTKDNAKQNHCSFVSVVLSNGWDHVEGQFDVVITNPPVRAGKKTVFSFYDGAKEHLSSGGLLYVVLQKKQGAPSSLAHMEELFGNCEILCKESGYWIMCAQM